jgi:prevent-host-death family protein
MMPAFFPSTWAEFRSTRRAISAAGRRERLQQHEARVGALDNQMRNPVCEPVCLFGARAGDDQQGRGADPASLNATPDGPSLFRIEFGEIRCGHVESSPGWRSTIHVSRFVRNRLLNVETYLHIMRSQATEPEREAHMMVTTLSSREFNQDTSGAKKAAQQGPVFITDRGRPAHVLLTIEDFQRLTGGNMSLAEALAQSGDANFDFDPPRMGDGPFKPADLG